MFAVCHSHVYVLCVSLYVLEPQVGREREGERSRDCARNTDGGRETEREGRGRGCCVTYREAVLDWL